MRHTAQAIGRWPAAVVGLCVFCTLLAAWFTVTHFKMLNGVADLLSADSPINRNYVSYKKEFNTEPEYVIVISSDDPAQNRRIADTLAARLREVGPGIHKVFCKLDFSRLEKRFLLYQSEDELRQIEGFVGQLKTSKSGFDLNSVLDQVNGSFNNEEYLRKKENWKDFKPLVERFANMLNQLADKIEDKPSQPTAGGDDLTSQDVDKLIAEHEYPGSFDHGRTIVVTATPGIRQQNSVSPYSATLAKIRNIITDLRAQNPGISIGLTGEPVLDDDEMETATRDSIYAATITFVLITLLFALSYREYTRPGLAILTLLMSVVGCFAATMLFVGHLNIITQMFVPMVLGLGIDFGIQIMGRYEEELGKGRAAAEAVSETLQHTGVAIITGGSTTAVAFFTMCFNDFKGLSELGIICGSSMLICLLANLILLPALFVLCDRNRTADQLQARTLAVKTHFSPALNEKMVSHPGAIIISALVLTAVLSFGLRNVRFDYNLLNLQNQKLESVQVENAMLKKVGTSGIHASIVVENDELARVLTQKLLALPSVKEVQSIASIVPDHQGEKLAIIQRIVGTLDTVKLDGDVTKPVDVPRAKASIAKLLKISKEANEQAKMYIGVSNMAKTAVETFEKLIPPLERAQAGIDTLPPQELAIRLNRYQTETFGNFQRGLTWLKNAETKQVITIDDVPPELRDRFVGNTGKRLLMVFAKENLWEREPLVKFVHEVQSVAPNATDTPIQNYAYIDLLRSSYQIAAIWAFAAIAILIFLHFRDMRDAFLAMLPLALGILWTLGIMGWFHIQFNPANIMTLPMLLGIGVAYGVYTTDRFREVGKMEIFSTSTGKAIILSSFTSLFGFAAMLISEHRGLFSMGLVMSLGVSLCLVTSLGLLPQILRLLEKKQAAASKTLNVK